MTDAKWGSTRTNQISTEGGYNHNWEEEHPAIQIAGFTLLKARKVQKSEWRHTTKDKGAPDEAHVKRRFRYRCGLFRAINVLSSKASSMTLYLEGHRNLHIDIGATEFVINPVEDERLADGPIAEIDFTGMGPRYGNLEWTRIDEVRLLFFDKEQMERTVVAVTVAPDGETRVVHHASAASSSSGDSGLLPLAAGVMLGGLLLGGD
jgi:hypothetical protein